MYPTHSPKDGEWMEHPTFLLKFAKSNCGSLVAALCRDDSSQGGGSLLALELFSGQILRFITPRKGTCPFTPSNKNRSLGTPSPRGPRFALDDSAVLLSAGMMHSLSMTVRFERNIRDGMLVAGGEGGAVFGADGYCVNGETGA